jgi:hypothetical protein
MVLAGLGSGQFLGPTLSLTEGPAFERTGAVPEFPLIVVGQMKEEALAPALRKESHTWDSRENARTQLRSNVVLPAGIDCTNWYTVKVGMERQRFAKSEE